MAETAPARTRLMVSIDDATRVEVNRLVELTGMDRAHICGVLCRIGAADSERKRKWIDSVLGTHFEFDATE